MSEQRGDVNGYKEWASVVQALVEGEQIIDLRKGGLREEGRHFQVQATHFWLYPTYEHERAELVKPTFQHWVQPQPTDIPVQGWAEVVRSTTIDDDAQLDALDAHHIFTQDYAAKRLHWKQRDPLWVLVLRVHRLETTLRIPHRDYYDGCSSWLHLEDLPELDNIPSQSVLSDDEFNNKVRKLEETLRLEPVT